MNASEHYTAGLELLVKSEDFDKNYKVEYRTALATQAAAHFAAAVAWVELARSEREAHPVQTINPSEEILSWPTK